MMYRTSQNRTGVTGPRGAVYRFAADSRLRSPHAFPGSIAPPMVFRVDLRTASPGTGRLIREKMAEVGESMGSFSATGDEVTSPEEFRSWFADRQRSNRLTVDRIPFDRLAGWGFDDSTGNLRHTSGRFFSVEGLQVRTDHAWFGSWTQPIIVQPEVGILGLLVKKFNGVLHVLIQAKHEPGNISGLQLSPTVQATRSNYTRVHRGSGVKYLEYFTSRRRGRILVDVLQSEQGSWFLHKRNRNMVVEALDDVPLDDDFCWLSLAQLRELLLTPHMVNMDTRTVLSCFPSDVSPHADGVSAPVDPFAAAVTQSLADDSAALHDMREILSWLTDVRSQRELVQQRVPLKETERSGWRRDEDSIAHEHGDFFRVIGVSVQASSREVSSWTQPLLAPTGPGLAAFVTKRINGVLHVLIQARTEAGSLNGPEMAPTVQCRPSNYQSVPHEHRPTYLDYVLSAEPERIRYDTAQSEEGGRFHHAENRYVVVEADEDFPVEVDQDFRWLTLHQLLALLPHSNYLNVEARSLVACIQALR
ncbi:NDP-hexose 2,3-dehydratase family protein [Streptomyces sp. NPDC005900]|uniref:NDP-hexose 2,3-dehydratase family protein n=2 Tax=unclassified Streptomyces TaxID=2593676 RepID=UPI0033CD6F25